MKPSFITTRNLFTFAVIFALWSKPGAAWATPLLTLNEAVRQSWADSPQLKAQEEQAELSGSDRNRRFWPNEPQLQLARNDDGVAAQAGLSLQVGIPGKAFALRRLDEAKAAGQKLELAAKRYDLAKVVIQAYLDCSTQHALMSLAKTSIGDLETISQLLRTLYDSGHSSQADTIGAQLQLRQAEAELITAQDKAAVSCERLANLPGLLGVIRKDEALDLPDDLDPILVQELHADTADRLRASVSAQIAAATAATAWWQQLPDVTVGVTRNHYLLPTASPAGSRWTTNVSVAVTLPVFYAAYESAEERRQRSQAAIDADNAHLQMLTIAADRDDAVREYRRNRQRLKDINSRDLVLAQALVESTFSAYRSGKVGFAELALARKTLTDLRAQAILLRSSVVLTHLRCLTDC